MRDTPKEGFKLKRGMIGLLCISAIAMLASEANAARCPAGFTFIGGTCIKTKGAVAEVNLKDLNLLEADGTLKPMALQLQISPSKEVKGRLFCGEPKSNQASEIVPVLFSGEFVGRTEINPKQVTRNGSTRVCVVALPTPEQLRVLDDSCTTKGFVAFDFVACRLTATVNLINDLQQPLETATYSCSLEERVCEALRWDTNSQMPKQRDYSCTGPK